MKKKIIAVSISLILLLSCSSIQAFADDGHELQASDDYETMKQTTNIDELENQLIAADNKKEASEIIANTDNYIITDYYDSLMNLNMEITNELANLSPNVVTKKDVINTVNVIESDFDDIKNIDYSIEQKKNDTTSVTYNIELKQGAIEIEIEDGLDNNTNSLNSSDLFIAGYHDRSVTMKKEYGDRYTSINNKSTFVGYPTSYFKFRIGYTLYKSKKISGRYIKAYEHEAGQAAGSRIKTEPITDSLGWDKKSKNGTAIKAHCKYKQRFYVAQNEVLTYNVKISYSVTPSRWSSTGAVICATGTIDSVKIA